MFTIVPSEYSNNFSIDPAKGVLTNSTVLDREALDPKANGKIELEITATDQGVPALETMATVTVNVEVSTEHTPLTATSPLTRAPTRPDPS